MEDIKNEKLEKIYTALKLVFPKDADELMKNIISGNLSSSK
ncbi:MAG: hypothetical protein WCG95_00140 [bacterium]